MKSFITRHAPVIAALGWLVICAFLLGWLDRAEAVAPLALDAVLLLAIAAQLPVWGLAATRTIWSNIFPQTAARNRDNLDERERMIRDRAFGLSYYAMILLTIAWFILLPSLAGRRFTMGVGDAVVVFPLVYTGLLWPLLLDAWFSPDRTGEA